jgi:hypothetical protein
MSSITPILTGNSRVFLIEGRARADHRPSYQSCMRMSGVSQGFGDIERHECPDPNEYGKFIEIARTRGATERPTTSLEGRYAMDLRSELMRLARKGCAIDVQLHFGRCTDPSDSNVFQKAIVLEGAQITNFGTDDLGALQSGDNTVVNENAEISAEDMYEILPISYGVKAASIVDKEVLDVTLRDVASCGDCVLESDGCEKIYAITKTESGSPGSAADLIFSIDKGTTWYAADILPLGANDPDELDVVGSYVVIVSEATGALYHVYRDELDGITVPVFYEVTDGFVLGGEPTCISAYGNQAFIGGAGGYIYTTDDPTVGVTEVDAGSATTDDLTAIHALSAEFAVAVGENGAVVYTETGTTWSPTDASPTVSHLYAVWVKDEYEWYVGGADGKVYYTVNKGKSWVEKWFPGSGSGTVHAIAFSTPSVGWLSHETSAGKGRILRSYDGGYSWIVTPEGTATLPVNDKINALATCTADANFVVGVGLADDGVDGYVVVGQTV